MFSNRVALAMLAAACIGAAGVGGFLATRQNATVPVPAAAQTQSPDIGSAAAKPVQETEAVVGDTAKAPAPLAPAPSAAAPATTAAPAAKSARRSEPAPSRTAAAAPTRDRTASGQRTASRQDPPPLSSSWPSSAQSQPSTTASTSAGGNDSGSSTASRADERTQDAPRTAEPPQKTFEELVVSADSVIGLQIENRISSETARVEDRVDAKVTRDVKVGDRVAIPAGAKAIGSVMSVERGGKFKERARLGIRFHTLVLADGTRVPMTTETIYREGEAPGNSSAAKVGGGAVGGAILGAILGGAKGAAIGATAGAGGGTAAVMAGDRSTVVLAPGTPVTVRVQSPVTITSEKE